MFFIGLNAFGDSTSHFNAYITLNRFTRLELTNMIIDELLVELTVDDPYSINKKEWDIYTYLLAKFQGNLEAGTINIDELGVEYIRLRRRIQGEIEWQDVITWTYDVNKRIYQYLDKFVANDEVYEYSIIPIAIGGVIGRSNYSDIHVKFTDYFIMDKNRNYQMILTSRYGGIDFRKPYSIFLPFSNKYPIVATAGELNYAEGSFSGKFFVEALCGVTDIYTEYGRAAKLYRTSIIEFLNDGKPKVLKDYSGEMFLCYVYDVKLEFEDSAYNILTNISFNFVEIDNKNDLNALRKNNLITTEVLP